MAERWDIAPAHGFALGAAAIDAALRVARRLLLVDLAAVDVSPVLGGEASTVDRHAVVALAMQRERRGRLLSGALRVTVGPLLELVVRRASCVRCDRAQEPRLVAGEHVRHEAAARISGRENACPI